MNESSDSRPRSDAKFFLSVGATLLATILVFAVGRLALAQSGGSTNCLPPYNVNPGTCPKNDVVPCQNATCVSWSQTFGSSAKNCASDGTTPVTYYSLGVSATSWQKCAGSNGDGSSAQPTCTMQLKACGTWSYYKDPVPNGGGNAFCIQSCGSSTTAGYCMATSSTNCPN